MANAAAPDARILDSRLVRRSPVYYGWVVLGVATAGLVMSSPAQTYAVALFIEHFIADLGLSRSLVSTLYTAATLGGSFALPFIGRRLDSVGPRRMLAAVAAVFGVACLFMGAVQNALMLGLGFLAIRMFGQGSMVLVSNHAINQWWVRRRGAMVGLSGTLMAALGLGAFPLLLSQMIPAYGWRWTYVLMGLVLAGAMAPLAFALLRDQPERYGLRPDGQAPAPDEPDASAAQEPAPDDWTLAEARRTAAFWITALGVAAIAGLTTGLFFHMVSIFRDNGLGPAAAATAFVPVAVTTAVVGLASGLLVDRVPLRLLLTGALGAQTLTLVMAPFIGGARTALLYGVLLGTTAGLMRTVNAAGWAILYGRRHLGAITGVTSTVLIAGSALGPMPLGIARDVLGTYDGALLGLAALPLALGVASLLMRTPDPRP